MFWFLYVQHFQTRQPMTFNDKDKANCLNKYFASISTVGDIHTQLPPFTKLTDNSFSHIICTEHEIETTIEVLNHNKANGNDGISNKNAHGCLQIFFKNPIF